MVTDRRGTRQATPHAPHWPRIESELAASLSTRGLPATSAIAQALVPEGKHGETSVQYVGMWRMRGLPGRRAMFRLLAPFSDRGRRTSS